MSISYDYIDYIFINSSEESKKSWVEVLKTVDSIGNSLDFVNFGIALIGTVCNIFHFLVFTRKSMRHLTINAFLAGIAICDLARMLCVILMLIPVFNLLYFEADVPDECKTPQRYLAMVLSSFLLVTNKISQQLAVWYGVTIAILRAVVLKNPFDQKISSLVHTKYGIWPLLGVTFIIFPFWLTRYFQSSVTEYGIWIVPSQCINVPSNYTQIEYFYTSVNIFGYSGEELYRVSLVWEGVMSKLIPSILLPIATIFLIWELKCSKKVILIQCPESMESSERSTKLVIFMAISFFVANFPLGLLYLSEFVFYDFLGFVYIAKRLASTFGFLNILNGTVHFLICFLMSSQYREVARELVGRKKNSVKNLVDVENSTQ